MTHPKNEKTTVEHWDEVWATPPRMRLPSGLHVSIRNLQRLLRSRVQPGTRFLEIGCAPGKLLAWVAASLQAQVSGLDYSERGIGFARQLFHTLKLDGDLRCEDVFSTTFEPASFDVVYSAGVIEHFEDPRAIVRQHLTLVKPDGLALIAIPHYGALYGRLQAYFDPANLAIHNLRIMRVEALRELAPSDMARATRAYAVGSFSPALLSFDKRWPRPVARLTAFGLNVLGLLQPFEIASLCPLLVLEIERAFP